MKLLFRLLIGALGLGFPVGILTAMEPDRGTLIELLFSNPTFVDAQLSPDGRYLASLSHYRGKRSIILLDLEEKKIRGGVTASTGKDVHSFHWIDNDHIIYHVSQWEMYTDGLWLYSVKANRGRQLLDPYKANYLYRGLVDPLLGKPEKLVFTGYSAGGDPSPYLYMMEVGGREPFITKLAHNNGEIFHYVVNPEGEPVYALESRFDKVSPLKWDGSDWTTAKALGEKVYPLGMLADNQHLLVSVTSEDGFEGLKLLNMESGEFASDTRYYPGYDLDGKAILDNITGYLLGVQFHHQKPQNFWFDSTPRQLEELVAQAFPDTTLNYMGLNPKTQCVYFEVSSDIIPPVIVQVALREAKVEAVYYQFPGTGGLGFRPMEPVSFSSLDGGETIHGYLTRPEGEGPFPTVLLIHGGPHARDTWGFDPQVQLLALSGYAVLQVNYRGSTGYGKAYRLPGLAEAAEKSVDDVIAGADWLVEEEIADPRRIAIMGGSFGGYISVEAAARAPDKWKAVASFAGVYDFNALYKQDDRRGGTWVDDLFADYDPELYARMSPVNHVDKIAAPVLIIHGKSDRRVSVSQAKEMVKALEKAGKSVESSYIGWGVHGLPEEKERKGYYLRILGFLDKHLLDK